MKTMLEPRMVAARIQPPLDVRGGSAVGARATASSHGGLPNMAISLFCAQAPDREYAKIAVPGTFYMSEVFICDAIRTPFGRYGGALSGIRTDDLAALPLKALMERNPGVDWGAVDDVVYGCANQSGEDNRNVAPMASLLAGLAPGVPGTTVNRLCGSSMDAIAVAARGIKSGELELLIAGGVESMSRAPFVVGKADTAFARNLKLEDTTLGWRFVNPALKAKYGTDSMPETGEIVAEEFHISRADQDAFALRSQQRAAAAIKAGRLAEEIFAVPIAQKKGDPLW